MSEAQDDSSSGSDFLGAEIFRSHLLVRKSRGGGLCGWTSSTILSRVLAQARSDLIRLKEENQANRVRFDELRDEIIGSTDGDLTPTQVLAKMEELGRVEVDQLHVRGGRWRRSSAGRRSSIVTKPTVKEAKERRESEREPKKTARRRNEPSLSEWSRSMRTSLAPDKPISG
ncbi:hypothetical protein H9Q69_002198 [Fusarium xylarioides]|uniref:Uncharacterized protein n=1 Tax=Fusarium xylarioides TaxID=221167 RepID=A0A9P7LAR0_9HYPO|nr:hypothetical protein H9Q70_003456 [Fusarium xylarioides]KAG5770959.1 hypothetical protein H9Q72_002333 [Fusarium xylarioides]KAG5784003.1 hypothetical protein H9Q73_002361 [Fusarium xylarioides]KAG5798790.1 hypothetical protein H9Q69_002198 [Fusarium xylarioides]